MAVQRVERAGRPARQHVEHAGRGALRRRGEPVADRRPARAVDRARSGARCVWCRSPSDRSCATGRWRGSDWPSGWRPGSRSPACGGRPGRPRDRCSGGSTPRADRPSASANGDHRRPRAESPATRGRSPPWVRGAARRPARRSGRRGPGRRGRAPAGTRARHAGLGVGGQGLEHLGRRAGGPVLAQIAVEAATDGGGPALELGVGLAAAQRPAPPSRSGSSGSRSMASQAARRPWPPGRR